MKWPRLVVDLKKIGENSSKVSAMCKRENIDIAAVTKGVCTNSRITGAMVNGGPSILADSRLANIVHLRRTGFMDPAMLLRIPMISELEDLIQWADYSLMSSEHTLIELNRICKRDRSSHGIIVMIDLGDLREGILPSEVDQFADTLIRCPYVRCMGVGVNFGCYGGTLPTVEKLTHLGKIAKDVEKFMGYPMEMISGGATSSLPLVKNGTMPSAINQLRIGEAILTGTDASHNCNISYLNQQTMIMEAELVEVKTKPSVPLGEIGFNAFGEKPHFVDRGNRLRAIAAVGKQDLRIGGVKPLDENIKILGGSSDHLILDVEDMGSRPHTGDIVKLVLDYGGMLSACTSPYVTIDFK